MRVMGIEALVPRPGTSKAAPGHKIYPYLLRRLKIVEPNHVWAADVTYIPMACGFLYLVAIIDWASRAVLAWRLSNTNDASFCAAALEEALLRFGKPRIFNSDQGSTFTAEAHMGSFGSRGEISFVQGQTPKAVSVSEVRARLHDAARFRARSTSHTVAARDGCTKIPLAAGRGSGGRNHSVDRLFQAMAAIGSSTRIRQN